MANYDSDYYNDNAQSSDREALDFYYRLFKKEMGKQKKRAKVLEFGCGVGHLTKRLARDFDLYALDISDYALAQVKKNAPTAKTLKSLSKIKDGSLDGIFALHVMEHIDNPMDLLKKFHKKLKPGGMMVFVVPNPDGIGHILKKDKWFGYSDRTHISLLSKQEWVRITKKTKFIVKKVKGDGMWDVPYVPAVPLALQKLVFFPPAAIQFISGRVFLPPKLGECLIIVSRKFPLS